MINELTDKILHETIQQLWLAGFESNHSDWGFAFDRAILEIGATEKVATWTEHDYDEFARELAIKGAMANALQENVK